MPVGGFQDRRRAAWPVSLPPRFFWVCRPAPSAGIHGSPQPLGHAWDDPLRHRTHESAGLPSSLDVQNSRASADSRKRVAVHHRAQRTTPIIRFGREHTESRHGPASDSAAGGGTGGGHRRTAVHLRQRDFSRSRYPERVQRGNVGSHYAPLALPPRLPLRTTASIL